MENEERFDLSLKREVVYELAMTRSEATGEEIRLLQKHIPERSLACLFRRHCYGSPGCHGWALCLFKALNPALRSEEEKIEAKNRRKRPIQTRGLAFIMCIQGVTA